MTKAINISTENGMNRLEEALEELQKRSRVRTTTAKRTAEKLQEVFNKICVSKKAMNGVKVVLDVNAQDFPNAYKYMPESTIVEAEYKNGHWVVTDLYRGRCLEYKAHVQLTEEAKEAIIRRYEKF